MSVLREILFATGNPHKLEEVAAVMKELGITARGLDSLPQVIDEPVEDQPTFMGNAILKARWYARHSGQVAMADDSGLVVDALGAPGVPGVHSARYAGVTGPRSVVDPANNRKLLEQLKDVPDERRTARFVCVLAVSDAKQTWAVTRGTVDGRVIREERGTNGFGYDPLFHIDEMGVTTAELPPKEKNAISHRGRAVRAMVEALRRLHATA